MASTIPFKQHWIPHMVCSHSPTPRPIKMDCVELCGRAHTAQRQMEIQIPIRFCVKLSAFVSVSVSFTSFYSL